MISKINLLSTKITLKQVFLFSLLFLSACFTINFSPIGVAGLLELANGNNILDFEFGYSLQTAHSMLNALGEQGRSFYIHHIIPLDFIFPVTYMLFFSAWILFLIQHTNLDVKYGIIILVPLSAMLFDWLENIGVILLLISYPNLSLWEVNIPSISGMLKLSCIIASTVIIFLLLLFYIIAIHHKRRI